MLNLLESPECCVKSVKQQHCRTHMQVCHSLDVLMEGRGAHERFTWGKEISLEISWMKEGTGGPTCVEPSGAMPCPAAKSKHCFQSCPS